MTWPMTRHFRRGTHATLSDSVLDAMEAQTLLSKCGLNVWVVPIEHTSRLHMLDPRIPTVVVDSMPELYGASSEVAALIPGAVRLTPDPAPAPSARRLEVSHYVTPAGIAEAVLKMLGRPYVVESDVVAARDGVREPF